MFNKKATSEIDTIVGESTKFYGNIHYSGRLHIDGEIIGDVIAEKDGSVLTISERGKITGNVQVHRIELNGEIIGDVYAINDIQLATDARVRGNLYYDNIEMDRGAEVNGNMIHGKPEVIGSAGVQTEGVIASTPVDHNIAFKNSTDVPEDNVAAATIPAKPVQVIDTQLQPPKIKIS